MRCGVLDITYIPSQQEGWLYLAGELDLCSRRLVGWKLDTSMAAPLVLAAFERAVKNWSNLPVLHHSDRGVQYASSDFRQPQASRSSGKSSLRSSSARKRRR